MSLVGNLRLSRAYYHCSACRRGHFWWDQALRLSPQCLTPAAQEVTALAGIQESFGKAAQRSLRKLAGLHVCESTVERTTEAAGTQLGAALERGEVFGSRKDWDWNRDHTGKTCAYVSVDATGIMMQGPNAGKVEGRMVTVGMVYNPQPLTPEEESKTLAKPCNGVRYLAGLYTLEELGLQLRRQAAHVGMEDAEQWIALSDGGAGLDDFFDTNFPRAQRILDFQHAAGHLADLAKLVRNGASADKILSHWCHVLKHAGGTRLLQVLKKLDQRMMTEAAKEKYDNVLKYISKNLHRMDYPEYRRRGWQIGSGAVESACKTVVNQRLCLGGMRWGEEGSNGVAHLRALYRSDPDQWDAYWATVSAA